MYVVGRRRGRLVASADPAVRRDGTYWRKDYKLSGKCRTVTPELIRLIRQSRALVFQNVISSATEPEKFSSGENVGVARDGRREGEVDNVERLYVVGYSLSVD